MRQILILLLLLCGCSEDRLRAVTVCGHPCTPWRTDPVKVKGACQAGTWECPEDSEPVCVGWIGPATETCDGVDNNCDGDVDEIKTTCTYGCGSGWKTCTNGVWDKCSAQVPVLEYCNGRDDDCDGIIDEVEDLPVEFCYTGPQGTVMKGVCHPGTYRCLGGVKTCVGQQLPSAEACNAKDDDCDGQIDEGFGTKIRFGVVTAPDPDINKGSAPRLYQDLGTAQQFSTAMAGQSTSGSWAEDTLGAIDRLANPTNPLNVSWTPGAKRIAIVLGDEDPQYLDTPQKTMTEIVASAADAGLVVHVFTSAFSAGPWTPMPAGTGGQLKDIGAGVADLEADLDQMIAGSACSPDAGGVDLMFIVDNSGSMGPYINNCRSATSTWSTKYQSP